MKNRYCPHIYMDKYDEWIKEAREALIEAKLKKDKLLEDYFSELLRNNISFKKRSLANHLSECVNGIPESISYK